MTCRLDFCRIEGDELVADLDSLSLTDVTGESAARHIHCVKTDVHQDFRTVWKGHAHGVVAAFHHHGDFAVGGIETFQETVSRNRLTATTRVIQFKCCAADSELARMSGFHEGEQVYYVQRVRYLDGKPLILDINVFLASLVPNLTEEIAASSIYSYIENRLGMQIAISKRRITVERATELDEHALDMGDYDCLAVISGQTFNSDGEMFEYTQSRHRPDYFCFLDTATRRKRG